MYTFYNNTFDFRILIRCSDYHQACEMLRKYLKGKKFGVHELEVSDFTYESVDVILQ